MDKPLLNCPKSVALGTWDWYWMRLLGIHLLTHPCLARTAAPCVADVNLAVGGGIRRGKIVSAGIFFSYFFFLIKARLVYLLTALVPRQLQEQSSPVLEGTLG